MDEFELPAVRDVCVWALSTSCIISAGSLSILLLVAASGILHLAEDGGYLSPAVAAEAGILLQYLLWCGAQGAVAAALALKLRPGPARRALAAVAAAATAGTYWKIVRCMQLALVASGWQRLNGGIAIVAVFFAAIVLLNFAGLVLEEDE